MQEASSVPRPSSPINKLAWRCAVSTTRQHIRAVVSMMAWNRGLLSVAEISFCGWVVSKFLQPSDCGLGVAHDSWYLTPTSRRELALSPTCQPRGKVVSTKVGCGRYGNQAGPPALFTGGLFFGSFQQIPCRYTDFRHTRYRGCALQNPARCSRGAEYSLFRHGGRKACQRISIKFKVKQSAWRQRLSRSPVSLWQPPPDQCRMRINKTAFYSEWLAFPTLAHAEAFVRHNPKFGLEAIEAKAVTESNALNQTQQDAVTLGRFNLGQIDPNARCNRAREYTKICDKLEKLRWDLWSLRQLRENLSVFGQGISVG
jgi:hypothetical protein